MGDLKSRILALTIVSSSITPLSHVNSQAAVVDAQPLSANEWAEMQMAKIKGQITLVEAFNRIEKLTGYRIMYSYDDVKKVADELPWDQEGFVVCDRYFHRVKIKSPAYVKAHFARNNGVMTYERLMEIILSGEKSEFLTYSPDYAEALEKVERAKDSALELVAKATAELKSKAYASRRDFALDVLKQPSWMQPFLFKYDNLDVYISKLTAANWVKILKTKGDLD